MSSSSSPSTGVRDRLAELQMKHRDSIGSTSPTRRHSLNDGDVNKVLSQVGEMEVLLKDVKDQTVTMIRLQNDILNNPLCDKNKIGEGTAIIKDTQIKLQEIRRRLRKMEFENAQNLKQGVKSAVAHIVSHQLRRLTIELTEVTNQFFKGQADYMERMKTRLKKQLAVTGVQGTMTEDEVNDILDNDSYAVFTQNFISDVASAETQLRAIEDRHSEIASLEKSVAQVNELFQDLNLLVAEQGDIVDSIEVSVANAVEDTVGASDELKKARKHQTEAKRFQFCIGFIIFVVLGIVIMAIVLAQQ